MRDTSTIELTQLTAHNESAQHHTRSDATTDSHELELNSARFNELELNSARFNELELNSARFNELSDSQREINDRTRARERTRKIAESLYSQSIERVHETISDDAERERFMFVADASADARETRASAVNRAYVSALFPNVLRAVGGEFNERNFGAVRAAIARETFASVDERAAYDAAVNAAESQESDNAQSIRGNAHAQSARARASEHAETTRSLVAQNTLARLTDVEFFERMQSHIAQRTERESLANAVLLRVRDSVLKTRGDAFADFDALALYRDARSELINAQSDSSERVSANRVQLSANELDALRSHALVAASVARDERERVNDTVEMLLHVFARERNAGTVNEKFSEYADVTAANVIEQLAEHDDDERSLIYHTLALRAADASETERARARGWAGVDTGSPLLAAIDQAGQLELAAVDRETAGVREGQAHKMEAQMHLAQARNVRQARRLATAGAIIGVGSSMFKAFGSNGGGMGGLQGGGNKAAVSTNGAGGTALLGKGASGQAGARGRSLL